MSSTPGCLGSSLAQRPSTLGLLQLLPLYPTTYSGHMTPCWHLPPSWSQLSAPWKLLHPHGTPFGASSPLHSSCGWHFQHTRGHTPHFSAAEPKIHRAMSTSDHLGAACTPRRGCFTLGLQELSVSPGCSPQKHVSFVQLHCCHSLGYGYPDRELNGTDQLTGL